MEKEKYIKQQHYRFISIIEEWLKEGKPFNVEYTDHDNWVISYEGDVPLKGYSI